MNDMALVPCTVLHAIVGRTELEHFDVSKSRMPETGLEHLCHMIHVIGKCPCNKSGIASGEDSQRINRRSVYTSRGGIHLRAGKRRRAGLSRRQAEIPVHMVQKEDIPVMADGVDQMIDSFAQRRSIARMGYDGELRTRNLDAGRER